MIMKLVILVCMCGCLAGQLPAADQPNVLILFTDDQRADTVHALGNRDIQTPHLDRLVQRGCSVTSAYCLGSNIGAVCRPSRNMLLSGRTYFRWTNPAQGEPQRNAPALSNTLPATFNRAGYETYHHGKRGNTAELIHRQFDHSHYLDDFSVRWSMLAGKQIVDDALAFLKRREHSESPWLMYLAFATPHDPRAASADALACYDAGLLGLPPNTLEAHPFALGSELVRDEWTAVWPRTDRVLRDQWHDYYAVITTIDQQIGRLLDSLKERGEFENTIVVFSSDHGLGMGSHGLMGKQNVYEAGYKAPMLLAGPRIKQGTADDPVYLMDLFPTLCQLTGIPVPDGLDGRSFAPMVSGQAPGPRDAILLSYTNTQRAIREGGWKLIRYPQINRTQLFNLRLDPHELNDLSQEPRQAMRIQRLLARMRELQREQGDNLPLSVDAPSTSGFEPPLPITAELTSPPLPAGKPGPLELHTTTVAGWTGSDQGTPFTVLRPKGGHFAAIAVGLSRTEPVVVTGLRCDVVGREGDAQRRTILVGDPNSRWTPLLDQMNPKRQPIGIHGASGHVIDRLGIDQGDGRISPAFGGAGGDTLFSIQIGGATDPQQLAKSFQGFHGTVTEWNGFTAIESLGLLFLPLD